MAVTVSRVLPMLYLASQSPRRRQLLCQLGVRFKVLRLEDVEAEPELPGDGPAGGVVPSARLRRHRRSSAVPASGRPTPRQFAVRLAERKARSVEHRVERGIILGVDTIVVVGRRILGKPEDPADARRMLKLLSGRTHQVISGICLLERPSGRCRLASEVSRVRFRRLAPQEIESYVATREPYDKAGAYAIQGQAGFFVERIEGDYFNIVGLPVARLLKLLEKSGIVRPSGARRMS